MSAVLDPSQYDAQLAAKAASLRVLLAPSGEPWPAVLGATAER